MFDASLRRLKDRVEEPLVAQMKGVSPNGLTLVALLVGLAAALCAAYGLYPWALLGWLLNRFIDGLDGALARSQRKHSDFGGYFDILADYVIYAAVPVGLALGAPTFERYLALALMLSVFYVNTASWMYLAAILEKRSARDPSTATTIVMPAGLIGGFETFLAYSIFLIFPAQMALLFSIFGLLVLFTTLQRLAWAWRAL